MGEYDTKTEESTNSDADSTVKGDEFGEPSYDYTYWKDQVNIAAKGLKKFHERGRKTLRRYLDERDSNEDEQNKYNLFWANTGVLRAALYAKPPEPTVKRTYDDYTDDVGRVAAEILERLLNLELTRPQGDMDSAFDQAMEDRLVPGLGQVWLRYDVKTEDQEVQLTDGEEAETTLSYEQIADEWAPTDWIYWEDFLWSPARVWNEVRWVARRAHMSREKAKKRFGEKLAQGLSYTEDFERLGKTGAESSLPKERPEATAEVWEIWCITTKKVYWLATTALDKLLDEKEDPLELTGFFPCPKPMLATNSTSNLVPRSDYFMVKDQYESVDVLNTRIDLLVRAARAAGVYDKTADGVQRLFTQGADNVLIPVDNWAMYAEKGGMKGMIDWIPLESIVATIAVLRAEMGEKVNQIYELTGISDIMRGATNARETLGAQQLKAQYGSVRLQFLQGKTAEFVVAAMRIKAEIISKHWQPETIVKKSLIMQTPKIDHKLVEPAVELIRNTPIVSIRLEVESDTMSIPDYAMERQSRMEYITAMGQLISQAWQAIEAEPRFAPLVLQSLQWAAAGFKNARVLEGVLDQAVEETQKAVQEKMNKPPPPDPEVEKMKMEAQLAQQKAQSDIQIAQQKAQLDAQMKQMDLRVKQMESQMGMRQDAQEHDQEMRQDAATHSQDMNQQAEKGTQDLAIARAKAAAAAKEKTTSNN